MQKGYLFGLIIGICFILTGCVQSDLHLTVQKNGSGLIIWNINTNKWIWPEFERFSTVDGVKLEEQLKQKGFQVERVTTNNSIGFQAKKEVPNFQKEFHNLDFQTGISQVGGATQVLTPSSNPNPFLDTLVKQVRRGYSEERSIYTTTPKLDTTIELTDSRITSREKALIRAFTDQMRFRLLLTLPVSLTEHNADQIIESKEEQTYIWNLRYAEPKRILLSKQVPSFLYPGTWVNWAVWIGTAMGIFLLIGLIVWSVTKKKLVRKEMD
ncbi:hypothetical protein [Risungbinella massiliensis]|uniref:hypothetical protein n=1 Tax=Risungbinella massiliensis TaxID=1329796 RepID=UPI0005CBACC6|nr:hypothetical protein [Risungbinella massiliensis]